MTESFNPTPTALVTVLQAARALKVSEQTIRNDIARFDLEPEHTIEVKGQSVKLFIFKTLDNARKKIEEESAERRALKTTPAPKAAPPINIDEVLQRLSMLSADVDELLTASAQLSDRVNKLLEQNTHMFKALSNVQTCLHQPPIQVLAPVPEEIKVGTSAAVSKPPPKPVLPKIVIVGLWAAQQQMITKEFGEIFDLRMFDADQARSTSFSSTLESCDRVLLLTNFINHSIEAVVKNSGRPFNHVKGGMSVLRDRLTTLFVELAPKVKS